jgi:hypothetical protein
MGQLIYIRVLIQNKSLSLLDFLNTQITLFLSDYVLNGMFNHKVIFVARSGRNEAVMNKSSQTRTNRMKSTLELGKWQELLGPVEVLSILPHHPHLLLPRTNHAEAGQCSW